MSTALNHSEISLLPLGANLHTFTLQSLPLVLSLPDEAAYLSTTNPNFFGETIGRVANRIKSGVLHLNGTTYHLPQNDHGAHTLHGGPHGWGKQKWSAPFDEPAPTSASTEAGDEVKRTRFELTSPDGDEGFPGQVQAKTWYTSRVAHDGKAVEVEVEYEVVFPTSGPTEGQQGEDLVETVVNVTNHTHFNIGPEARPGQSRTLEGTRVKLGTVLHQEVDELAIPTGKISGFPGVQVGEEVLLGKEGPVFDHCFVLPEDAERPGGVPLDTRQRELRRLVEARHDATGVRFEAWSTEPAFQFYTGEFVDLEYQGQKFGRRSGFCVEASRFVDAAGHEETLGMVRLKRGETWGSRTVYKARIQ